MNQQRFNELLRQAREVNAAIKLADPTIVLDAAITFTTTYNTYFQNTPSPQIREELVEYYSKGREGKEIQQAVETLSGESFPEQIDVRGNDQSWGGAAVGAITQGTIGLFTGGPSAALEGAKRGAQEGYNDSQKLEYQASALSKIASGDIDGGLYDWLQADPTSEFQLPEQVRSMLGPQVSDSIEKALREEGITTNGQAAAFLANAKNLGFTVEKIQQFSGGTLNEKGELTITPEELQSNVQSGIRFVQQATLSDPTQTAVIKHVREAVDNAENFEDAQERLLELSSEEGNEALRDFIGGFAMQEWTGFSPETSQRISSTLSMVGLTPEVLSDVSETLSKFGITPKFLQAAFTNIKDFGKELFLNQSVYYSKDTPLYGQVASRFMKPYREAAISEIEDRQREAGVHNFRRLGLSDEDARYWHGIFSDPTVRGLSDNLLRILLPKLGASEELVEQIMTNKDALLDGFSGDTVGMYDRMARNVSDVEAMMQVGQAASLVSLGPTAKNGWMRAEDMSAAYQVMRKSGWNVENYIVRSNDDMQNVLRRMDTTEQEELNKQFAKEWAARKADEAAWDVLTENPSVEITQEMEGARAVLKNPNASTEELEHARKVLGDAYLQRYTEALGAQYNYAMDAAKTLQEGGTLSPEQKEFETAYRQRVGGYTILQNIAPIRNALQDVMTFMNQVPEAAKLNGGKKIDEIRANELVRALGGSNYNGDYTQYAERTIHMAQMAAHNDIPLERLISAVAESGKTLQQMGLSPVLTQVVGEAGMVAFDSAFRASGGMVDADRLMAQTQQDAAHVVNSEISRNLTWLIANANNPNLGNDQELQALLRKVEKGKDLDQTDIEHLRNTEWLRKHTQMDGGEWEQTRSDPIFEWNRSRMGTEQSIYVQRIAMMSNQKEYIDRLNNDRFRTIWSRSVSDETAKLNGEGYESADEVRTLETVLMRAGIGDAYKRADLLTGKHRMSTDEEAQFRKQAERAGVSSEEINRTITLLQAQADKYQDAVKNKDDTRLKARENLGQKIVEGNIGTAAEMGETLEAQSAHLTPLSEAQERQYARIRDIQATTRLDIGETTVEQMMTSGEEGGKWAAQFLKTWFGGYTTPEKAQALLADGTGGGLVIVRALQTGDADSFFDFLLGPDHETEDEDYLLQELGFSNKQEAYKTLSNESWEQIRARAKKSSAFNQALGAALSETNKKEAERQRRNALKLPKPGQTPEGAAPAATGAPTEAPQQAGQSDQAPVEAQPQETTPETEPPSEPVQGTGNRVGVASPVPATNETLVADNAGTAKPFHVIIDNPEDIRPIA